MNELNKYHADAISASAHSRVFTEVLDRTAVGRLQGRCMHGDLNWEILTARPFDFFFFKVL